MVAQKRLSVTLYVHCLSCYMSFLLASEGRLYSMVLHSLATFSQLYTYIPLLAVTGMVQEQTRQVEEARTECHERRGGSSSGFQERLRHSIQWPDAAVHRHGLIVFTLPVQ